jgi:hypothetical protein
LNSSYQYHNLPLSKPHRDSYPLHQAHLCPALNTAKCIGRLGRLCRGHVVARRDQRQRPANPHTMFQERFRLIRLPVVRKPLSPIAPRHSIDNWPSVARPSRRRSFCRASRPSVRLSVRPSSCSMRKATCRTSRGFRVGSAAAAAEGSEVVASELRDWHLKGAFGLSRVC